MRNDELADSDLRTLVIATLDREPDATFDRVRAHLRSTLGRTLESAESDRLRDAYQAELANPTGAHRVGAAEQAAIATNLPFKIRPIEIAGLAAGLIPLVLHLRTTTPATVDRATGATVAGGVYDMVAMLGGFVAIVLGLIAARQAMNDASRRAMHFALVGVILLIGVYQSLLGLGLLHKIGLFSAG